MLLSCLRTLPLRNAAANYKQLLLLSSSSPAATSLLLSRRCLTSQGLAELQKARWDSYLASGRGSEDLFHSIDVDKDGTIQPKDIKIFLDSVQAMTYKLQPRAFLKLEALSHDHPVTLAEFQEWLVDATKLKGDSTSIQTEYQTHPQVGPRSSAGTTTTAPPHKHSLGEFSWNESTMAQNLRRMQYAVRGEIVLKADALQAQGKPIIFTNIGNPQALGQQPITYYRQVMALCDLPAEVGVDHPHVSDMFPKDVLDRARDMRDHMIGKSGTGAYTNSQGIAAFRQHVADFIQARDGHPAFAGDIFLSNGASSAIDMILTALIASNTDAILIPIPQYPIYSASIARLGGRQVGYELDEEKGWGVSLEELERRLEEAQEQGLTVKGMVLINPGNPTGQVMQRNDLEMICRFCSERGIVLLADEVYQRNVYVDNCEFISTKKIAMETEGCKDLELISFHSTSKGLIGECGRRGGYMELHGICPAVHSQIYKLASSFLCSGVAGQVMMSLMVRGPQPGDDSYDQFVKEETAIYDSLGRRAKALVAGLNAVDGISCNAPQGAMYAFPRLDLPQKALETAQVHDQTPDTLYCLSLLENTGICVVPASGFGQKEGRVGFRTTFLPPEEELNFAIENFGTHHRMFCEKYA